MSTIALSIAREQQCSIVTDNGSAHEALLETDEGRIFDHRVGAVRTSARVQTDARRYLHELAATNREAIVRLSDTAAHGLKALAEEWEDRRAQLRKELRTFFLQVGAAGREILGKTLVEPTQPAAGEYEAISR